MFVNKIKFFSALTGNKLFVSYQKCCSLIKRATSTSKCKNVAILQAINGICYVIARGVTIE